MVAVPPTFAVEATEKANTVLHNSVAVLPFENLSPNLDEAYFAAGIHEELLIQFPKIRDMNMISSISVVLYEDSDKSTAEIASELNVESIMKGSVRYTGNRIGIAIQLFDASGKNQLWSKTYEHDLSDIFSIQAEIVESVSQAIGAEISAAEKERIEKVPTRSLEAYALYLKARVTSNICPDMPPMFYQYLDQAIALDPNFALAHA